MSIGPSSYPLPYSDNDWNICSIDDDTSHYTPNLAPHSFPSSSHQSLFQECLWSRDYHIASERGPWLEATLYSRQTNQWPDECCFPVGYRSLFPESRQNDYGAESQDLALSNSQDWSGTFDFLNSDKTSQRHNDLENCDATDPQAAKGNAKLETLATDTLAAANSSLQSQAGLEPPSIIHGAVSDLAETLCIECGIQYVNKRALNHHTRETQHAPYACKCGGTFSRVDILKRHLDRFNPNVTFPCPHCSRFSGSRAFSRRDHLTQHLRGYHNIEIVGGSDNRQIPTKNAKVNEVYCPHEECSYHRPANSGSLLTSSLPSSQPYKKFNSQKEFTRHLREVHNESLFPCQVLNCGRINGQGFFRKRDLLKHQREHHRNEFNE